MNVIAYKIWADLWGNKTRTLQIVLIIALGAFGSGLVIGGRNLTTAAINADWRRGEPATMKISVDPPMTAPQLIGLERIDGITAVEGFQSVKIEWRHGAADSWKVATLNARTDYTDQPMTRWDLVAGTWPAGDDLAMERGYTDFYGIALGDTIETRVNERVRRVRLIGILNSYDTSPTFAPDLTLYTTHRRFGEMTGQPNYNTVLAKFDAWNADGAFDEARAAALDAAVQSRLDKLDIASAGLLPALPTFKRVAPPTLHFAQSILTSVFLILGLIGVLIIALGALLVYNNISAIITQQVNQIGIMKAIGARRSQILIAYLLLILAYGILACLLSLPLAAAASHGLKLFFLNQFDIAERSFQVDRLSILLQIIIALLSPLIAALVPLRQGAQITVREAISTFGLGGSAGLLDRLLVRLHRVSYTVLLMLGNTFRHGTRVTLTEITLVGGGVIFIAIMGVRDSTNYTFGPALTTIHRYQVNLTLQQDQRRERIVPLLLAQPGVSAVELWQTGRATVRLQAQAEHRMSDEAATLYGIPAESQLYQPQVRSGRWLQPTDGKVITMHEELAARVGVGIGDWVTLRYPGGREGQWQVVGFFFDPARDSGIYLPQASYAWELNRVNKGNYLLIKTTSTTPAATIATARTLRQFLADNNLPLVVGNLLEADTIALVVERRLGQYSIVVGLLSMMAVVIAIVGSVGLSGALSLSVLERTREIGVMRAIGASSLRISLLFIGEGLLQGILSWLIAVPLALPAANWLTTVVLSPLFGDTLLYQFQPTGLLLWLAIIIVLGIVASWWPARKATHVSVRESLAYQ